MELYKGKYWEVVYCDWCQDFLGQFIISGHKETLSEMTSEEWVELGIIVNKILEKDKESLKKIKGIFPNCYICNIDGKVIVE